MTIAFWDFGRYTFISLGWLYRYLSIFAGGNGGSGGQLPKHQLHLSSNEITKKPTIYRHGLFHFLYPPLAELGLALDEEINM